MVWLKQSATTNCLVGPLPDGNPKRNCIPGKPTREDYKLGSGNGRAPAPMASPGTIRRPGPHTRGVLVR